MFFLIGDTGIASCAGDNHHTDNIDGAIKSLEKASEILFKRLNDNLMKSNTEKCHLLVSTYNTVKIKTGNFHIINSKREKLLGVKCEHKLSFYDQISELCRKGSLKFMHYQVQHRI